MKFFYEGAGVASIPSKLHQNEIYLHIKYICYARSTDLRDRSIALRNLAIHRSRKHRSIVQPQMDRAARSMDRCGENPTELKYAPKLLHSHFGTSVDKGVISSFPASLAYRKPNVLREMELEVYCTCRCPDDSKLMVECKGRAEWFHALCLKLSRASLKEWKKCTSCQQSLVFQSLAIVYSFQHFFKLFGRYVLNVYLLPECTSTSQ